MMGYSPSGASGTSLNVSEYRQESMKSCQAEAALINETRTVRYDVVAFCITSIKG